eukprot:CAMPEP_0195530776 /NCGR_PEP_ID=MMETSP0794_2-20130614/33827_1 /TAXON_ID=515487 /ORGANISM="Stephanopyxis turris, Strain CCMP 815" /LENGTH=200 /DNA_ID=CAMNT_0040662355 /DNA_START=89 /DNA_END=691 /DNA_ORIENTATION=-
MASKPIAKPTKVLNWEDFYKKTDNANKLMDRVWYCIACTEKDVGDQKIFWEHWYWKEGEESKDLTKGSKAASNHTLTISAEGKEIDYPIWPLSFTTKSMKMYPAIDLKCLVIAPIGLSMQPVAFPTDDSRVEFRVDFCEVMGKKMYFVFVLDPNMSEEDKTRNFDILEKENGVLREWFHDVQWEANYEIGSTGEPDINPK